MARRKPVALIVLDGWGVAPPSPTNAISQARTPFFDQLVAEYPALTLQAAGEAVGLLWGEMGNSEVGHLCLGAGRIVFQSLPRINRTISQGTFGSTPAFHQVFAHLRERSGARLHLVGLLSTGGVHSHREHLYALLDLCAAERTVPQVHVILDGRDTARDAGVGFVGQLQRKLRETGGRIATISGRFWAMDRDHHWERTERVFGAMTEGRAPAVADPVAAVTASYARGVYDEEFEPVVVAPGGVAPPPVGEHDAVICFNFRADRARQLTASLALPGFSKFPRPYRRDLLVVTMTEYDKDFPVVVAFPPDYVREPVAKVMAEATLKQLHIAETEKYAHVTFFFNGGREAPFNGEDRILVPSPRVASYAEQPAMSAYEVTAALLNALARQPYDFAVVNFANPDMVGHTGQLAATIKAIEVIDDCLSKIVPAVLELNGVVVVTADHGNAEEMVNLQTGEINKEHSVNAVPCLLVAAEWRGRAAAGRPDALGHDLSTVTPSGMLADVGPTILQLLGLPIPGEMTGRPLV